MDVLVIGGGVIGLSVARSLAKAGADVTLLGDDRPGASAAAAGMLCPSFEALQTGGQALARLGAQSLALWDGFAASLADEPAMIGYERTGVLGVGYPPGALPGKAAAVPGGIEASGAVLVADEGQVDPRLLLRALRKSCKAAGVRFVSGRATQLTGDGSVTGAEYAGARLRADATILASGASVPGGAASPLPVRGRAFMVRNVIGLERVVRSPGVYLAPKSEGRLYIGATEEEAGASRDGPAATDGLWSEAMWLAPALREAEVLERFDGWRARTHDELPVIGPHAEKEGLFLALGHHRNGVLLAPLTAELMTRAVLARSGR